MPKPKRQPPICPYCERPARLIMDSSIVYRANYGPIWHCAGCQAWVGTHKRSRTHAPLGTLANAELRDLRKRTHGVFDPLWRGKMRRDGCAKGIARKAAYTWLAGVLGIEFEQCHIGLFDEADCKRAIEACASLHSKPRTETAP